VFRFGDVRPDQWPTVAFDELSQGVFDVLSGEFIVVVTAPDEFTA